MSESVVSNKIRKTCEGCSLEMEYELVNITEETIESLSKWHQITRGMVVMTPEGPQFRKFSVHACSLACVNAAAVKLQLPPQEPEREIDLASLRMNPDPDAVN
jgi:hypothetical protein